MWWPIVRAGSGWAILTQSQICTLHVQFIIKLCHFLKNKLTFLEKICLKYLVLIYIHNNFIITSQQDDNYNTNFIEWVFFWLRSENYTSSVANKKVINHKEGNNSLYSKWKSATYLHVKTAWWNPPTSFENRWEGIILEGVNLCKKYMYTCIQLSQWSSLALLMYDNSKVKL
jgi:hypothetical protein